MTPDEYLRFDATGLAGLIARKEVSARDVIAAAIARIEALNPAINAVVATCFEEALAALPEQPAGSQPFFGVPYLIKDLFAPVRGLPLTHGSRLFAGNVMDFDAETVARLRRAGFVILGRTNSPEFGLNVTTEPMAHGATRNPWNRGHSPGGSSGGAAAAVAAGMLPAAHATDSGGSIRIPASCCGLVGLKPTRGRNPFGPHRGDANAGLSHEHAVTRSVRDCAAILDATSGPMAGDPYCTAPPAVPFLQAIARPPERLRIGFAQQGFDGATIDPECRSAVVKTANLCRDLGHEVDEAMPDFDRAALTDACLTVLKAGMAGAIGAREAQIGRAAAADDLEPVTHAVLRLGRALPATAYVAALAVINREVRRIAAFFADYDLLLTPTLAQPPAALGELRGDTDDGEGFLHRLFEYAPFTLPFNATGQPAISLPLHATAGGLPVGVQFVAPFGADAVLLRLAAQIEQAAPWPQTAPPGM